MTEPPDARRQDKRCEYHKDHGHDTNSCYALKDHLEELVQDGRLMQHVRKNNSTNIVALRPESPPLGVIHMVYSMPASLEVHTVQLSSGSHSPMTPMKQPHDTGRISFDDSDLIEVTHPHIDPFVIEPRINKFTIERVLIDQGSTLELMYYKTFIKLGFTDSDLSSADYPLFGFNANLEYPLGKITLPACYYLAAKRPRELEVHSIEVPDRESLEAIGWIPSEKETKALHRVKIDESPDKFFMIGASLD
ncbi:uncharacterized protein LOC114264238 [Camellia sinensis]|uniref:uncharacterized protein LOC114264238 n=1 Tax=Camellia sinensis TaxID=4442 RepID=UPI0010358DD9|nr:uncharacterized protein LOC114264238 [Camellia sinensis]